MAAKNPYELHHCVTKHNMSNQTKLIILAAIIAVAIIGALLAPRIPQPQSYHLFADQRTLLGIPNAHNVGGNAAFFIAGAIGLFVIATRRARFHEPSEKLAWSILFFGVLLTTFGSGYYHLAPSNERLVWDRLPMTIGFMGLFTAMISEHISINAGRRLLLPLLAIGAGSVFYWRYTESIGAGDLRPYAVVQFGTLSLIPLMIALFPARYTRRSDVFVAVGIYALSKVSETLDAQIYAATSNLVSGHALKHVIAGAAVWWLARMLSKREPLERAVSTSA